MKKEEIIEKYSLVLSAISGLMLAAAFSFQNFWWICFFAMIPLYLVVLNCNFRRLKFYFNIATFSLGFYVPLMLWLYKIEPEFPLSKTSNYCAIAIAIVLLGVIQGIYLMLATIIFPNKKKNNYWDVLSFSFMFIFGEWLQEYTGLLPFPWGRIGVIPTSFTTFIQSASLFGSLFISLIILVINGSIAFIILNYKDKKKLVLSSTVLSCVFFGNILFGVIRLSNQSEMKNEFSALVVQGNFSGLSKWKLPKTEMIDKYIELTKEGSTSKTTIVVWPETAIALCLDENEEETNKLKTLAKEINVTLVVGAYDKNAVGEKYNSLIAISPTGEISEPYYKQILAPFGEYFPMGNHIKKIFPFMCDIIEDMGGLDYGKDGGILDTPIGKIGGVICFESIFSQITRRSVNDGAELIAIATNDSWFGESSALYQHNAHAVLRAVENKRYVLRASNTGLSSIISPYGEILVKATPYTPTYASVNVSLIDQKTLYSILGDIIIFPGVGIIVLGVVKNRKRK